MQTRSPNLVAAAPSPCVLSAKRAHTLGTKALNARPAATIAPIETYFRVRHPKRRSPARRRRVPARPRQQHVDTEQCKYRGVE
jgi:hypothetical protein